MENSHNRLNIVILDACRSNPFSREWMHLLGKLPRKALNYGLPYALSLGLLLVSS